jgi:hypothetical protein
METYPEVTDQISKMGSILRWDETIGVVEVGGVCRGLSPIGSCAP